MSDLPPFATVDEVAAEWRTVSADEFAMVEARIRRASDQIRDEVPLVDGLAVDERIAAGTLRRETVRDIVVAMVHRIVMVPGFVRQRTITVDDVTKSETFDSSISPGEMVITDREMSRLLGRKVGARRKAFTIHPGPGAPWA